MRPHRLMKHRDRGRHGGDCHRGAAPASPGLLVELGKLVAGLDLAYPPYVM
ncbi:hypothetical protein V1278_006627 [Bradyrhizobium sp. AZCC 1577]